MTIRYDPMMKIDNATGQSSEISSIKPASAASGAGPAKSMKNVLNIPGRRITAMNSSLSVAAHMVKNLNRVPSRAKSQATKYKGRQSPPPQPQQFPYWMKYIEAGVQCNLASETPIEQPEAAGAVESHPS